MVHQLNEREILEFDGKRVMIGTISQIIDGNFINFYVVKIGGKIFCDDGGIFKFRTKKEAEEARERIKRRVRKVIDELKAA